MNFKIAFCGSSGVGKTSIARWVAQELNLPLNPNGSRSTAAAMGFANPYDVDKAGKRGEFQQKLQKTKILWEQAQNAFVTDRTPFDDLIYACMHEVSCVDDAFLERAIDHTTKSYTHVIYCPMSVFIKLGDDEARVKSLDYHKAFDLFLQGLLLKHPPRSLLTLQVEGKELRQAALRDYLNF